MTGVFPPGLHVREEKVAGVGPWLWVKEDKFGWEQPAEEFAGLRELILSQTRQRREIIQAGGGSGMYPRLWSADFETVYTFEPEPRNFYCLVANCPSERIIKLQAALSDRSGFCTIDRIDGDGNIGTARISVRGQGDTVPTFRLDDFNFPVVDVLQLDCEGHEEWVVSGAQVLIERNQPVIALESPTKRIAEWLTDLGYEEVGRTGGNPDIVYAPKKT